jgi:hypothetical protein
MITIGRRPLAVLAALAVALLAPVAPAGAGVVQRSTGLWPDGQVRYSFGPGVTAADRAAVRLAMASWTEAGAPVRFVAATSGPRLIILRHQSVDGANRCRATVGRGGVDRPPPTRSAFERPAGTGAPPTARSFLILSGECRHRVMVHELGHVLGLDHEHERSDRSGWLSVRRLPPPAGTGPATLAEREDLWRLNYSIQLEIPAGTRAAANPVGTTPRLLFTRQYDPCSVMHYLEDPTHRRRGVDLAFTSAAHAESERRSCSLGGSGGRISSLDIAVLTEAYAAGR